MQIIRGHAKDLGGLTVRRVLPALAPRFVGPFVFLDHMGPADFGPGAGIDVRPHPHIGLATVTYLFEGVITHRDSLGCVQDIEPGALNWMIAGRGIAHSERTPSALRGAAHRLHGMQAWVALPQADVECEPRFIHHAESELPVWEAPGIRARLIAGSGFGQHMPVAFGHPIGYAELHLDAGVQLVINEAHAEQAIYLVEGRARVAGREIHPGELIAYAGGAPVTLEAGSDCHCMWLAGAPLDGPRLIWWNFVAATRERIDQASRDWREGRFAAVPGEHEFIPLPE